MRHGQLQRQNKVMPWGALVKRMHNENGSDALLARATVGGFRKLLPAMTVEEKKVQAAAGKLAMLERKNPERVGRKQMLLAELISISNESARSHRKADGEHRQMYIMRKHSDIFNRLSSRQKEGLGIQAQIKKARSFEEVGGLKESAMQEFALARDRVAEAQAERTPLTLTSCKLSEDDMQDLGNA